jgi:hypothetical protein
MNPALSNDGHNMRYTDSNSLLRKYDAVTAILNKMSSQLERARADKLIQHLIKELQKRNVNF